MQILREADSKGWLEDAKKWQELNFNQVTLELDAFENLS